MPQPTYMIREGIRRSMAHYLEGFTEIEADILNADSEVIETTFIPLDSLRSCKNSLDISNSRKWWRLENVREAIRTGRRVPPIEVVRGSVGIPLSEVKLDTLGE